MVAESAAVRARLLLPETAGAKKDWLEQGRTIAVRSSITGLRLSRRAAVDSGCEVVLLHIVGRSTELWQIEWNAYLSSRRDSLDWQGRR
jgi:hypothetical protein